MVVIEFDVACSVECNANAATAELHLQRVPHILCDRSIDVLDRAASTAFGVIKRYVVLKRVGASDVVVVAVLPSPDLRPDRIFRPTP